MADEFYRSDDSDHPSTAELDLLKAFLEPDDAPYPWNVAEPESEAYFVEAEQQFVLEDCQEQQMQQRSQTFFACLDRLWSTDTTPTA